MASTSDDLVGQVVDGKYRIDRQLGRGGMGAVYRATHLGTERTVALKVISSKLVDQTELVERFSREAKAAGQLRHPNVVNVTDFGFWQRDETRLAYLVMEYLDGVSLGDVLKEEKRLPIAWVVEILEQVCMAMEKAHARGIIHRDLKPDNIWLEPNDLGGYTVKVLDFGLARLASPGESAEKEAADVDASTVILGSPPVDLAPAEPTTKQVEETAINPASGSAGSSPELTTAGSVLGTPNYMSPEQCRGRPLDHRADIYSLGIVAYEMLTGERPFPGRTTTDLIKQHVETAPPSAHEKRASVPRGVSALVAAAMAKEPEERPASAAGFASALRARSEGLGAILRRALLLYTEHFGTLLLISLIAYLPSILVAIYDANMERLSPVTMGISLVASFAAFLITFSGSIGLIVPAVANLLVRPLSPLRLGATAGKLLERAKPFLSASARFYARLVAVILCVAILVGTTAGIVIANREEAAPEGVVADKRGEELGQKAANSPAVKAAAMGALAALGLLAIAMVVWVVRSVPKIVGALLYGPAVIMETITGAGAIARSRELAKRIARPLVGWTILLALWFGAWAIADGLLINPAKPRIEGLGAAAYVTVRLAATILIHPIVVIGLALLYFKARQTNGETLAQIVQEYEKDLPAPEYRRSVLIPSHFTSGRPRML